MGGAAPPRRLARFATAAWLIGVVSPCGAAQPPGTPLSFVACPVARDTGPDTDLCFFAEHEGRLYALVNPPDWGNPQLKHRVLVEGRVKEGPLVCGATPLDGRASVLGELDPACATIEPFDGVIKGAVGGVFNSGTPQQRAAAQEVARLAAQDPRLSLSPAILDPPPSPPPQPPFETRTLVITYPYDSDRGPGPDMLKLRNLVEYARAARARRTTVIGYRASSRLTDGSEMTEKPVLAEARARKVAGIMAGLGFDPKAMEVSWQTAAVAGTGDGDWLNRRVVVTVTP